MILGTARDREDAKLPAGQSTEGLIGAREDAVLEDARNGADESVRDDRERRQLALASLLAFERDDTDLRLEIERRLPIRH